MFTRRHLLASIKLWIPAFIIVTAFSGLVYLTIQQMLRQDANDPQIQMAQDAVNSLSNGTTIHALVGADRIDPRKSLSPFFIIYTLSGNVREANIALDGRSPLSDQNIRLPEGVLAYTQSHKSDRITWQPETGVRIAAVILPYGNGYVLVGRSLQEVEQREDQLFKLIAAGWFITSLVTFGSVIFLFGMKRRSPDMNMER